MKATFSTGKNAEIIHSTDVQPKEYTWVKRISSYITMVQLYFFNGGEGHNKTSKEIKNLHLNCIVEQRKKIFGQSRKTFTTTDMYYVFFS